MAVAFDASSESHTGTTGATTASEVFTWTHTPVGTPKGVLVFTFVNAGNLPASGVAYGTRGLAEVPNARASDTAGEPGDTQAWLLSPWTQRLALTETATSNTANGLQDVNYDGAYYAAVGASGTIIYKATDPTGSWSAATSGTANELRGVAFGNGYWASVGIGGVIRYKATDPTGSWSGATSGVATNLYSIAYGNGYWVAVGAGGVIIYKATDPTGTWSAATSGTVSDLRGVHYANGYWVAAGANQTIRYKATDPTGSWSGATSGLTGNLRGVTYGNGYWAVTQNNGTGGVTYKATDPTGTWSAATTGTTARTEQVTYGDGQWLLTGREARSSAALDATWGGTVSPVLHGTDSGGTRYLGGYFVDVGSSGKIAYGQVPATGPTAIPTGAQTVSVMQGATNVDNYAVAITVTADYGVEATGVVLQQGDQALANTAVDDGSPGTDSVRFAGVFSGLAAVPSANAGSTELQNIDFGNQVISVIRETTAGQGSRSIGWTGASDDVAAVYLAIREAIVPWTVGVPIR